MELYIENDYYLSLWKKEDDKWFMATGWSDDTVTWVEHVKGPRNPVTKLEDIKNDPKHKF